MSSRDDRTLVFSTMSKQEWAAKKMEDTEGKMSNHELITHGPMMYTYSI